jgi:hypothetical protein
LRVGIEQQRKRHRRRLRERAAVRRAIGKLALACAVCARDHPRNAGVVAHERNAIGRLIGTGRALANVLDPLEQPRSIGAIVCALPARYAERRRKRPTDHQHRDQQPSKPTHQPHAACPRRRLRRGERRREPTWS